MARSNRSDVELVISARNEAEKTLDELLKKYDEITNETKDLGKAQDELVLALKKVRQIQKDLDTAGSGRDSSLEKQTKAIDKLEVNLQKLKGTYAEYEKAASATRQPNQRLTDQLDRQQAKFDQLRKSIAETQVALRQSRDNFDTTGGVDDQATQKIEAQRKKVLELGQAWRDVQQKIKPALDALNQADSQNKNSQALAKSAKERLTDLRNQVKATQDLIRASKEQVAVQKQALKGSSGKSNSDSIKRTIQEEIKLQVELGRKLKDLRNERDAQVLVEREVRTQARETAKTFSDQQKQVDRLQASAKKQKQAYTELKESLVEFSAEQEKASVERQTKEINRLESRLDSLKKSYEQAGNSIKSTQEQISKASGPSPVSVRQFENLKTKIKETEQALKDEKRTLNELELEFTQAGASSQRLNDSQQRLNQTADKLTNRLTEVRQKIKEVGDESERSAGKNKRFNESIFGGNGSRQSLSYLQRIRGELLSIAATYTGLYAVGDSVRSIYDAVVLTDKATARLSARFDGDSIAIGEEIKFVREEAERLGLQFDTLLDEYTRFITNIPEGSLTLEQIRFSFSGIAEAARVVGLNNEDVKATFKALGQIASKGAVQLEELKGQLGERIPKAIELTAKGLSDLSGDLITTEQLLKRINEGEVTSDTIVALASALKEEFGPDLSKALESPQTSMAKFQTALYELKLAVGESGFLDTLTEGLGQLTEKFSDPEFIRSAEELAAQLADILDLFLELVKYADQLQYILGAFITAKVLNSLSNFAIRLKSISDGSKDGAESFRLMKGEAAGLKGTLGTLLKNADALSLVFSAGFGVGTYLRSEFKIVQEFGARIVAEVDKLITRVKGSRKKLFNNLFFEFYDEKDLQAESEKLQKDLAEIDGVLNDMLADIYSVDEDTGGKTGKQPKVLDPEDAKKQAEEFKKSIAEGLRFFRDESVFDDLAGEFEDISEELNETAAKTLKDKLSVIESEYEEFLSNLGKFQTSSDADILAIQEKARALIDDTEKKRAAGRVSEERAAKAIAEIRETSEKRIAKIREQQDQLKSAETDTKRLIELRKEEETNKYYKDQLKKVESDINKLLTDRKDKLAEIKSLSDLSLIGAEESASRMKETNDEYVVKLREALTLAEKIAKAEGNQSVLDFVSKFDNLESIEAQKAVLEQINQLERSRAEIIANRNNQIQVIQAQEQAGLISRFDAEEQIAEITNQTNEVLRDNLIKAIEYAKVLGDAKLVANLEAIKQKLIDQEASLVDMNQLTVSFSSGMANALIDIGTGAATAKEAFRSFFASFFRQLAQAILQALILKAIMAAINPAGSAAADVAGSASATTAGGISQVPVMHTGGIVGRDGTLRTVDPAVFLNAVRYHTGGIAGSAPKLKSNEVPAILERGEEVTPKDQVGKESSTNFQVINAIDSDSIVKEAMRSPSTTKTFVNWMRANKSEIKQVLS